jgi:hypothetical protein
VSDKYDRKTAKVIKGIYFEENQSEMKGDEASKFVSRIYANDSIHPEEEEQLLGVYEYELIRLVNSIKDLKKRTIRRYNEAKI